ncbi:MAG: hypothetical protein M3P85_11130 [Actinomycetota bacterium]|nr:hypothetical protein [Actinomycetota bacterium]
MSDNGFRDFDAAWAEQTAQPLRFRLGGEDFTVPRIGAGAMLRMAAAPDDTAAAQLILDALVAALGSDGERFRAVVDRVPVPALEDVVRWLVEESTGRPTQGRAPSPGSPPESTPPSRVVSLTPATTSARSG